MIGRKKLFFLVLFFLLIINSEFQLFSWGNDSKKMSSSQEAPTAIMYNPRFELLVVNPQDARPFGAAFVEGAMDTFTDNTNPVGKQFGKIFEGIAQQMSSDFEDKISPHLQKMSGDAISSVFNIKNAVRFGGPLGLVIALPLVGWYGSRVLWKVVEKKLINPKPKILLPGSKVGQWDRAIRWKNDYVSPKMIFDASVKSRLEEIEEKAKNIRTHINNGKKMTYDNLLLYGRPGTGKTLFAQILADKTDMDFLPVTAASLLQSGIEGIKYIDEIFDMANRSKYGAIIFVDEADALFIDRNTLSPDSDHYKMLNHILSLTGNGSNKFMLIAATNHALVMDEAMGRRFQDRVLMPVPAEQTRRELIDFYANSVLFNQENGVFFVNQARALLSATVINTIVKQSEGLSHAEIKDMIVAMAKKAFVTKAGVLTKTHIDSAVAQAIEKLKASQQDKAERDKRLAEKNKATDFMMITV